MARRSPPLPPPPEPPEDRLGDDERTPVVEPPRPNGPDGDERTPDPSIWRPDPRTWPALIWRASRQWGLGTIAAVGLGLLLWNQTRAFERVQINQASALHEQTAAMKDLAQAQREMTEEIVELNARMEAHLFEERQRHHR
mgnify:CR=1 FL=1